MKEKFKNIDGGGRNALFFFAKARFHLSEDRVGDGEDSCESLIAGTSSSLRRCRAGVSELRARLLPRIPILQSSPPQECKQGVGS